MGKGVDTKPPVTAQDAKAEFTLSFSRAVQASERLVWRGELVSVFWDLPRRLKEESNERGFTFNE